jgi:hypothetical protein
LGNVLLFAVPHGSVYERYVNRFIGHGLDVGIFKVHGARPENDVDRGDDIQYFLVQVHHRFFATAA